MTRRPSTNTPVIPDGSSEPALESWSPKGKQRSAERHYDTWSLERILSMAPLIRKLAAVDCVLLLWAVWSKDPDAKALIKACEFEYKTVGFVWIKTTPNATGITLDGEGLHTGTSLAGTRANTEYCLHATCGSPRRLATDIHSVIIAPVGEHSEKPDEVYRRIEWLFPGPYLELFARKPRPHWTCWGDELSPLTIGSTDPPAPSAPSANAPLPVCELPDIPDSLRRTAPRP
jgi:N6-adenosine-specific RNA methylase IME4